MKNTPLRRAGGELWDMRFESLLFQAEFQCSHLSLFLSAYISPPFSIILKIYHPFRKERIS